MKQYRFITALSFAHLGGCDSQEDATHTAWDKLREYCLAEKTDSSQARLVNVKRDGFGWFFDYEISKKPEYLVTMKVGPWGWFELWRSREN